MPCIVTRFQINHALSHQCDQMQPGINSFKTKLSSCYLPNSWNWLAWFHKAKNKSKGWVNKNVFYQDRLPENLFNIVTRRTKCPANLRFFAGHFRLSSDIFKLRMTGEQPPDIWSFFPHCCILVTLLWREQWPLGEVISEWIVSHQCFLWTFCPAI